MRYGHFDRARWGVSTIALLTVIGTTVPAVAQVNEIVISATRRAGATVQNVPLAVTAISADTIQNAGIKDVRDLTQVAPSFQFFTGQSNSAGTTAYIRGIGTGGDNPGFESAVGFFIDGVYRNRSGVALSDLPAVDHIELLRGPQGTLFGKNTTAGAISVTTAAPSFEQSVYGFGTFANYDAWELNGGVEGPLAKDKLAVRIDADARQRDGYIDDIRGNHQVNTRNRWYLRGQALWIINQDASFRLIADVSQTDEMCCSAVTLLPGSTAVAINSLAVTQNPKAALAPAHLAAAPGLIGVLNEPVDKLETTLTPGRDTQDNVNEWGISGELNWDLKSSKMTSITSYRDWAGGRNQDVDFNDLDRAYRSGYHTGFQTFTEELRFQGNHGMLDWLVGGYYAHERLPVTDTIRVGTQAAQYVDALALGADSQLAAFGFLGNEEIYNSVSTVPGHNATFLQKVLGILGSPAGGACGPITCASSSTTAAAIFSGAGPISAGLPAAAPTNGQGQNNDNYAQTTQSIAIFTHDVLSFSEHWKLTGGLRYNDEKKDLNANLNSVFPGCGVLQANATAAGAVTAFQPNPLLPAATQAGLRSLAANTLSFFSLICNPAVNPVSNGHYADNLTEREFNGTLSLSWQPSTDSLYYLSYSRGYKAGGWNLDRSSFQVLPFSPVPRPVTDLKFKAEFNDAYEAGWKWSFDDDKAALNGAIFYEKISDYQENAFSGFDFVTFNVPVVKSQGAELEFVDQPSKHFQFTAGLTYLDTKYDSTVVLPDQTLAKGTQVAYAAHWTGTSSLTWTIPCGDSLQWLLSADGRWTSGYPVQTLSRNPITDNGSYSIINARAGIGSQDGKWILEGWAKNVFNTTYYLGAFVPPEQTGTYDVYPGEPITYGATLRFHY